MRNEMAEKKSPLPVSSSGEYIINLNEQCNNACLFCSSASTIGRRPISTLRDVRQKIKNAAKMGYKKVNFFGGEPTTYSFLLAAIRYASSLNFKVTLNTNARKFSSSHYAKKFQNLGILNIHTSLHHYRPHLHDKITGVKGSFYETISGFRNILHLKIPLTVNIVINKLNYQDLPQITQFVKCLGIKNIKFSGLVSAGRLLENLQLFIPFKNIKPFLEKSLFIALNNRQNFFIEKLPICLAPRYRNLFIFDMAGSAFFEKLPICKNCQDNNRCNGIDRKYLELFPADKNLINKKIGN